MLRFTLIVGCLCIFLSAGASLVPINTARTVAQNVYYERAAISYPVDYESITFSQEFSMESDGTLALYVFNVSDSRGWVIVSAESNAYPVLAYSKKGSYIPEQMPPAFDWWLANYMQQIHWIRENEQAVSAEAEDAWLRYSSRPNLSQAKVVTIGPLVQSRWNQDGYYNDDCPGGSVTGCVATAMAQVMRFWSHPAKGKGSHTYTHPSYGPLSADFENSTYNWANMPYTVSAPNADVAKLMFHCGVSVDMNYSPGGSGANMGMAASALPTYFRYSYFIRQANKNNYNDIYWCINIRSNLIDSLPVLYAGGNHAFVCDGFEYPDHFHFNMGWGGSGDGYFYISSVGQGGVYSSNQTAVLDIRPAESTVSSISGEQSAALADVRELYMSAGLQGTMSVYPNPAADQIRISLNSAYEGNLQLVIRDGSGRTVFSSKLEKDGMPQFWDIDLQDVSKGFYFVELSNSQERVVEKVVKL